MRRRSFVPTFALLPLVLFAGVATAETSNALPPPLPGPPTALLDGLAFRIAANRDGANGGAGIVVRIELVNAGDTELAVIDPSKLSEADAVRAFRLFVRRGRDTIPFNVPKDAARRWPDNYFTLLAPGARVSGSFVVKRLPRGTTALLVSPELPVPSSSLALKGPATSATSAQLAARLWKPSGVIKLIGPVPIGAAAASPR